MIFLIVLGAILLVILLLLLIPVRVDIAFNTEFHLTLRYAFIKLPLVPGKPKPEGEKEKTKKVKKKKKSEEKEGDDSEKEKKSSAVQQVKSIFKKNGVGGFLSALGEAIALLAKCSKRLLSKFRLKRFDLYFCVGGGNDAAEGAIMYGRMSAAIYNACEVLLKLMPCRKPAVTVDLDYRAPESRVDFSAQISLQPLFAVREAFALLGGGIPSLTAS